MARDKQAKVGLQECGVRAEANAINRVWIPTLQAKLLMPEQRGERGKGIALT